MRLDDDVCWERLRAATHGVLGTVRAGGGVDLVPVVFVVIGTSLVVPIDTVKPKSGGRLQRLVDVERDPACSVLVERYDDDWSQLWWVRAHGVGREATLDSMPDALAAAAETFPPYRAVGSVTSLLVVDIDRVIGWSAT